MPGARSSRRSAFTKPNRATLKIENGVGMRRPRFFFELSLFLAFAQAALAEGIARTAYSDSASFEARNL
jgi:hypothetical protein